MQWPLATTTTTIKSTSSKWTITTKQNVCADATFTCAVFFVGRCDPIMNRWENGLWIMVEECKWAKIHWMCTSSECACQNEMQLTEPLLNYLRWCIRRSWWGLLCASRRGFMLMHRLRIGTRKGMRVQQVVSSLSLSLSFDGISHSFLFHSAPSKKSQMHTKHKHKTAHIIIHTQ